MKLQLQIEEEKKTLEEQKAKERQHLAEQQNTAAVKIQARFRAFLVRKKYASILKDWKDEIKKKQKLLEKVEREMKEKERQMKRRIEENRQKKEEEKKRQEELERQKCLEQVRRREEYEKKKESLRLQREKQLQIRREEERKLGEKTTRAVMSESGENNKENVKKDKQKENTKVIREQNEELNKQVELKEKQTEMMDETNNWMIPAERNLTPNILDSEKKEHFSQVHNENIYINSVPHVEENYSQTRDLNEAPNSHASKDESVNFGSNDVIENKASSKCSSPPNVQPNASNREVKDQSSQSETMKKTVFIMEDANEAVRESWDRIQDVAECSSRVILPDDIEKKRINWMNTYKSWSKIYEKNQRKQVTIKKPLRKSSVSKMPPLSTQKIIHSGPWSTLQQVTIQKI